MASQRLIRFVENVARGLSDAAAARAAGYAESVARDTKRLLWSQPEAARIYREAQKRHGRPMFIPPASARAPKPLQTYFVRDSSGRVKIGKSSNPVTRLMSLRRGSAEQLTLVRVVDGDYEQQFHIRFAEYKIKGDWFVETGRLKEFLADEQNGKDPANPVAASATP